MSQHGPLDSSGNDTLTGQIPSEYLHNMVAKTLGQCSQSIEQMANEDPDHTAAAAAAVTSRSRQVEQPTNDTLDGTPAAKRLHGVGMAKVQTPTGCLNKDGHQSSGHQDHAADDGKIRRVHRSQSVSSDSTNASQQTHQDFHVHLKNSKEVLSQQNFHQDDATETFILSACKACKALMLRTHTTAHPVIAGACLACPACGAGADMNDGISTHTCFWNKMWEDYVFLPSESFDR